MPRKPHQTLFHRSQIGRAQRFIRMSMDTPLTLDRIAREAGASPYHFVRIFLAYTGETPFDFLRRVRLMTAVRMLQEDPVGSITEIALSVGYETPSAFDKVFKKGLGMSPREFRNLGKDAQYDFIYRLSKPLEAKENEMELNMSLKHEVVTRPTTHYVYFETTGPFSEVAPPAWDTMFPLLMGKIPQDQMKEFLGLSGIDKRKQGSEAMIYEAGVGVAWKPADVPKGLRYKKIEAGRYAKFLLTGPYSQIWIAFSQIFKTLSEAKVGLREEFCIENYLNDPKVTPEDKLLTEILIPVP
jgi:AraC family transcriptional regulator